MTIVTDIDNNQNTKQTKTKRFYGYDNARWICVLFAVCESGM